MRDVFSIIKILVIFIFKEHNLKILITQVLTYSQIPILFPLLFSTGQSKMIIVLVGGEKRK